MNRSVSQEGSIRSRQSSDEVEESNVKAIKTIHHSEVRRTHRACDRCRVKKSKCDGQQPCSTCKSNERTCVFSALRRRDIRKWHCHMQDTVDEAIQRLYRACKESSSFPGILPDERDGYVTTESILRGMGFMNLELGPKVSVHTAPGSLPIVPVRSHFSSISSEPYLQEFVDASSDGSRLPNYINDSGPIQPGVSPESAPTMQQQYPAPSSQSPYFHTLNAPPFTTSEHDGSLRCEAPLAYHHQAMTQHRPRMLQQDHNEHAYPFMNAPVPFESRTDYPQSRASFDFREQHVHQAYPVYDHAAPFVDSRQIWFAHNDMAAVPR